MLYRLLLPLLLCLSTLCADDVAPKEETEAILFDPPSGWHYGNLKDLPPSVKAMVIGKGKREYPPSINLGMEKYGGTLKDYLKIVKRLNEEQNFAWKDLGTIPTGAGDASLSQLDMRTEWGNVRMMHVILVREGYAYVMTAAALRDEFSLYYQDFFKTMRSLRFGRVSPDQLKNH